MTYVADEEAAKGYNNIGSFGRCLDGSLSGVSPCDDEVFRGPDIVLCAKEGRSDFRITGERKIAYQEIKRLLFV